MPRRRSILGFVVVFFVLVLVSGAGISGFLLGISKDAAALSESTAAAGAAYYFSSVSSDEALSQRIEKVNVQQTVIQQANTIDKLEEDKNNTQRNVLDALLRNMTTKLSASRSSTGYKSYIQQAKVLISLNNKISAFNKTPAASTIDISTYTNEVSSRLSHIPTLRPIPGVYEGYGWRIHPVYKYYQFHPADDVGATTGTSIKAAGAGTVTYAAYDRSSGNMVKIDHGNGFVTIYMHMKTIKAYVGQNVSKGYIIGLVGSTGTSTAPHLHFEVHYHGTPFNPTEILIQW